MMQRSPRIGISTYLFLQGKHPEGDGDGVAAEFGQRDESGAPSSTCRGPKLVYCQEIDKILGNTLVSLSQKISNINSYST